MNENATLEFSVTIPSKVPPVFTLPVASRPPGVFRPMARPSALEKRIFVDKGLTGKVEFAAVSFDVFASAVNAFM